MVDKKGPRDNVFVLSMPQASAGPFTGPPCCRHASIGRSQNAHTSCDA